MEKDMASKQSQFLQFLRLIADRKTTPMAHRAVLTARQRAAFFDLPMDEALLLQHYTLSDEDIDFIRTRRRPENQIGFALQLCALRYPGRLLRPGEIIPKEMSEFLAAQLGVKPDDLLRYAERKNTRHEHLETLRKNYGYEMFKGKRLKQMRVWLDQNAEGAQSSEGIVRAFVEECRVRQIILPGITVMERMCADALVAAERQIETRVAARLDSAMRARLDALLSEEAKNRTSRFVWLRGPVAVWCRSFDSVMCNKGDEPWAQEERKNFEKMRCELL